MKHKSASIKLTIAFVGVIIFIAIIVLVKCFVLYECFPLDAYRPIGESYYCPFDFEMLDAKLSGAGQITGKLSLILENRFGGAVTIDKITVTGDVSGSVNPNITIYTSVIPTEMLPEAISPTINITVTDMSQYKVDDWVRMAVVIDYTNYTSNVTWDEVCEVHVHAK